MKITVIHPSRGRSQQAKQTACNWISRADNEFEYILSLDTDSIDGYHLGEIANGLAIVNNNNHSAIEAINNAAKIATGNLFVVISDDFDCPEHWDTLLRNEIKGCKDFVLKTRDGIQKTLVTLPIMDSAWYERYGYVYHPEYKHMGADCELTAVAIMTGRLIYSDLLFPHNHYSTGRTPKDAVNDKNDLTYQHGDEVLAKHRAVNFGIQHPLCSYESIVWH